MKKQVQGSVDSLPENIVIGRNPVKEVLKSGRPVDKILVAGDRTGIIGEIASLAVDRGIPVQRADSARLDELAGGGRHQGVLAFIAVREYADFDDITGVAGPDSFILLLNEVSDPHNLGAILRTAEAAGVQGVVIPKRRSATLTPAVARASAGAVEHVPVARVPNMVQAIEAVKSKGFWVTGADASAGTLFWEANMGGPLAMVIGGEEKGLGKLVKEKCDSLVRLPMSGKVNSLNASVAAALMIYEVLRQKGNRQAGLRQQ